MRSGRGVIDGAGDDLPDHRKEGCRGLPLLTAFCALAIAYGSLIPFQFDMDRFAQAKELGALRWRGAGPEDILTNLAIYAPLGALVAAMASRRRGRDGLLPCLVAALTGGVLGLALEVVQIGLPARVSSLTDAALNALGAGGGAAVAIAVRSIHLALGRMLGGFAASRPWHVAATALTLGLLALELLPFDFVTSQAAFEESMRRAQWVLGQLPSGGVNAVDAGGFLSKLHVAGAFALLGYLAGLAASERGRRSAEAVAIGAAHASIVAFLIELLQLLTVSHALDVEDWLLRCFAGGLGAWAAGFLGSRALERRGTVRLAVLLPAGAIAVALVIEALGLGIVVWWGRSLPEIASVNVSRLPFEAMWRGSMAIALVECVTLGAGAVAVSASLLLLLDTVRPSLRGGMIVGALSSYALMDEVRRVTTGSAAGDMTTTLVVSLVALATCASWQRWIQPPSPRNSLEQMSKRSGVAPSAGTSVAGGDPRGLKPAARHAMWTPSPRLFPPGHPESRLPPPGSIGTP